MLQGLFRMHQPHYETVRELRWPEGTRFFTDEYGIYHRVLHWGYEHRTVCHSQGEHVLDL